MTRTANEAQHHRAVLLKGLRTIKVMIRLGCSDGEIMNEIDKIREQTKFSERVH